MQCTDSVSVVDVWEMLVKAALYPSSLKFLKRPLNPCNIKGLTSLYGSSGWREACASGLFTITILSTVHFT